MFLGILVLEKHQAWSTMISDDPTPANQPQGHRMGLWQSLPCRDILPISDVGGGSGPEGLLADQTQVPANHVQALSWGRHKPVPSWGGQD